MKYIASIILTVLFVLPAITKAQESRFLSLEQCRQMAIENSETVKIAEQNAAKAQSEKQAAKSSYTPSLSASATGLYMIDNIEIASEMLPTDYTIYGGGMASVTAQQAIYAGGKIRTGNQIAEIGISMANANKELQHAELIYNTDRAYYQYLSVKAKLKLAKEYQNLLKELEKVVNDSYEIGLVNRNELLKVQVKYNEASLQVQKAGTGLTLTKMALCQVIGININSAIEINDSIASFQFVSENLGNINATNRIEYQLLQSQVDIAEKNVKLVQGDYLPTLGGSVGYSHFLVGLKDMDNYDKGGLNAMVSLKIPITTFGERKGKTKAAKAGYEIKQMELQQTAKYLQLEIEQARLNYIDAYAQVEMTKTSLEQANENMRISDDNYRVGMETIVNVLEAKAEWQNAYSNKIEALTNFKIQESNLLRVSNKLK